MSNSMKITVPKGAIVKYSKSPIKDNYERDFEIDASGYVTTKFLKQHNMKVGLAHEEDCGCGSEHPFGAVYVVNEDCSNQVKINTDNSTEIQLKEFFNQEIVISALNEEDAKKEWFARMQYETIYELYFKNYPFWKRVRFVCKFGWDLIWRYLLKNK